LMTEKQSLIINDLKAMSFGQKLEYLKLILDEAPGKERLELLKATSAIYGHRTVPGTGMGAPLQKGSIKIGVAPKARPQPKGSKSPQEKEIQSQIATLNKKISEKSKALGSAKLPLTDPLLLERGQLFRDLKECQVKPVSSQSKAPGNHFVSQKQSREIDFTEVKTSSPVRAKGKDKEVC
jgi:hypothetical protein